LLRIEGEGSEQEAAIVTITKRRQCFALKRDDTWKRNEEKM
jgi:hypothetical protein